MERFHAFLHKHRIAAILFVGVLLFCGIHRFSTRGIEWSIGLAPDELAVANWINAVRTDGYIRSRVYPSGWFQLARVKTWFEIRAERRENHDRRRRSQEGSIDSAGSQSRLMIPEPTAKSTAGIQTGRDLNVILLSSAAVFLFLCALAQRMHPVAALIPGLLVGLHPFVQEHVHYCETDTGLVCFLALSLLAFAFARRNDRSAVRLGLFCFSVGFAVACKYTLVPLLVLPAIQTAGFLRARPSARTRRGRFGVAVAAYALATLVLLAGFTLGTPTLYKDLPFFFSNIHTISGRTYAEIHRILGPYWGLWWAPYALRAGSLVQEAAKLGWIFPIWCAVALGFCFRPPRRDRRFGIPLLMGISALFAVIGMPWIRNQEFLPFIVCIAAVSAAPVDWAIRSFRKRPTRRSITGAVAILLLAATTIVSVYGQGERMTSAFHRRETRAECQNWLATTTDGATPIATDSYLGYVAHGSTIPVVSAGYLDEHYPEFLSNPDFAASGARYFLWNRSFVGRSSQRHPFTRHLIPEAQREHDRFLRECPPLRTWTISDGALRPTFSQPDIELRMLPGENPNEGSLSLPFHYPRPNLFRWGGHDLYAGAGAPLLGPRTGIQTVGARRWVRPTIQDSDAPVWAVCCMEEGVEEAQIRWERLFTPKRAWLSPGKAQAFRMKSSTHWLQSARDIRPGTRLRMRGNDQTCLCLTDVTDDAAEVACLLRLHGNAEDAFRLALDEEEPDESLQIEGLRAAVAIGKKPPESWVTTARAALEAYDGFENGESSDPERLAFCGTPLRALRDFANVRLLGQLVADNEELPVFLPAGDYTLTIRSEPGVWCPEYETGLLKVRMDPFVAGSSTKRMEIRTTTLHVTRPMRLRFGSKLPARRNPVSIDLTISWDPLPRLQEEIEGLRNDLAAIQDDSGEH